VAVYSVAPKKLTILSILRKHITTNAVHVANNIPMFMVKVSFAFFKSPLPRKIDVTVEVPIANNIETANIVLIIGIDKLTAANAYSPTPLATNIPSAIVYKEYTHIAATEGTTYFKKVFFIDITSVYNSKL